MVISLLNHHQEIHVVKFCLQTEKFIEVKQALYEELWQRLKTVEVKYG